MTTARSSALGSTCSSTESFEASGFVPRYHPISRMQTNEARGWRVGHLGRDQMYYEELRDGVWERIDVDGEMLMGPAHHVIYFATPERWLQYPPWASRRRDEIVARIMSEFREPDYEYHGAAVGSAPASAGPGPAVPNVSPPPAPARASTPPPAGTGALLVVVLLLLALAGAMGWLVTRGVVRGETTYPARQAYLRRTVSRQQEPGVFWLSIGVYAVIGSGALTLGVLGARAGLRLRQSGPER